VNEAERRVKYSILEDREMVWRWKITLPIKLAQFGVLPVIFAVSLLSFPQLIAQFLASREISEGLTIYANRMLNYLQIHILKTLEYLSL
jgi:preprotein translocase subunit SecY